MAKRQTEGPATVAAAKQQTRDAAVNMTLQSSLTKAGVKEGLLEGAIALMKRENEFEVEASDAGEGHVVLARTKFGLYTVERVVEQFMDGEGAAFRDKRSAPSAGYFTSLLSGLKERR